MNADEAMVSNDVTDTEDDAQRYTQCENVDVISLSVNNVSCPLTPLLYQMEIADSTISYLKTFKHLAKRSSVKHQEFGKLCLLLFHGKLNDIEFMSEPASDMGFDNREDLLQFINIDSHVLKQRGRPLSDKSLRQEMYNHWIENSDISTD